MTGTDLTTQPNLKSSLPNVTPREIAGLLDRMTSRIERLPGNRFQIAADRAPGDDEKDRLRARNRAVTHLLARPLVEDIEKAIAALLTLFPADYSSSQGARAIVRQFAEALKRFPLWAVHEACRQVRDGVAPGVKAAFAPKPPQLAQICAGLIAPLNAEQARIRSVLDAEVYSPPTEEEQARVAGQFDALLEDLKAIPDEENEARRELRASMLESDARFRERELRAAGIDDGRPMSLALRKQVGAMVEDAEINAFRERRKGAMDGPAGEA